MLFTYFICSILFIDQSFLNLYLLSQSPGMQHETQIRSEGFQTIGRFPNQIDYNKYITRETT